ncbi:MAG: hypothetical protein ACT4OU_11180 [Hyphomicrobium sp.]
MLTCVVLVIGFSIASGHGAIAAEGPPSSADATAVEPAPIILAGRWTGPQHGFGARAARSDCGSGLCNLIFDIVACGPDWCGIAVGKNETCGAVAMKLQPNTAPDRVNAFGGKLELAKGSDPYVIEAWYSGPGERAGEGEDQPHLSMVGDTGPELMMFRRSFPFSAELARTGEAKCTLEKATS